MHRIVDGPHPRVRCGALGEEPEVERFLGGSGDSLGAVPGGPAAAGRSAAQWAGLPYAGAAWVRADMRPDGGLRPPRRRALTARDNGAAGGQPSAAHPSFPGTRRAALP
ncbi:hypothetical protein GCM10020295_81710 [Streptomyces cinereospinus]